ncbi:MAG: sensor histidine kinase [Alcanivorax sp.]|nr:sensor histidine kinase [Alcanivorax sp.]
MKIRALPSLLNWRLRLIWIRSGLVFSIGLALSMLAGLGHTGYPLLELSWLAALMLPSLLTLTTLRVGDGRHAQLLTLELVLDVLLFVGLIQGFGGAGNPLSFYLLVPVLIAALTLPRRGTLLISGMTLSGYLLSQVWHQTPAMHSPMHALSLELSALHSIGMATVFVCLLMLLTLLGQTIQRLVRQQQRQQEHALTLAGRRERMYQIAATLADQAHELNTPLGTLVMLADNMLQTPQLPDSLREDLHQVDALARRVAQRLRSNDPHSLPARLSASELIKTLKQHLCHLAPTLQIGFVSDSDPHIHDGDGWLRVLSNLAYNAMDAGATRLDIELLDRGSHWLLQVSDDGPSHSPSERQGLGLGLALITTTLEQLGASLDLEFGSQRTCAHIRWSRHAP